MNFTDLARVRRRTMLRLNAVIGEVQYNYVLYSVPHVEHSREFTKSFQ